MPPFHLEADFPYDTIQTQSYVLRSEYENSKMIQNVAIHLIISAVGVFIGISACIVFVAAFGNYDVGFWAILSGILAAVCFHLHWVKGRETLERWHTKVTLRNLNVVGTVSAITATAFFIWYLFLTFYYQIPIVPVAESTVIQAVWSLICGKWGILLMYCSHNYELIIQEGSGPILTESNA